MLSVVNADINWSRSHQIISCNHQYGTRIFYIETRLTSRYVTLPLFTADGCPNNQLWPSCRLTRPFPFGNISSFRWQAGDNNSQCAPVKNEMTWIGPLSCCVLGFGLACRSSSICRCIQHMNRKFLRYIRRLTNVMFDTIGSPIRRYLHQIRISCPNLLGYLLLYNRIYESVTSV